MRSYPTRFEIAQLEKALLEERQACAAICQDEMDEQYIDSDGWYAARACRDRINEREATK